MLSRRARRLLKKALKLPEPVSGPLLWISPASEREARCQTEDFTRIFLLCSSPRRDLAIPRGRVARGGHLRKLSFSLRRPPVEVKEDHTSPISEKKLLPTSAPKDPQEPRKPPQSASGSSPEKSPEAIRIPGAVQERPRCGIRALVDVKASIPGSAGTPPLILCAPLWAQTHLRPNAHISIPSSPR